MRQTLPPKRGAAASKCSMFRDRGHAGELLAELLGSYRGVAGGLVLGLPRGGVPVAAAVARELGLPLDLLMVRKIGAPMEPELAVGAVAQGALVVLDEATIAAMGITAAEVEAMIERERGELARREGLYREGRGAIEVGGAR